MQRTLRRAIALATLAAAAASDPAAAVRELRSREQPSATEDDPGAAPDAGDLRPVRSAARAYHAALTRLAAGSPDEAAAAVAALDPRSAIEAADSTRPSVRGAVAVIEGVATADPEALLPPLVLHVDLFRRYRAAHKPTLSDHHTAMTAYIAALYAERAGTPAARAAAVEVLTAVGVAESGGAIYPIAGVEGAEEAFRAILAELRSQYVLGYYPSRNLDDGSWHPVTVRVRGQYRVRTRDGYIDY